MKKRKFLGFSLIELMIVLAIIGILSALAYPSYQEHIMNARRADGKIALVNLAALMEHYYTENNTYLAATITGLGASATSPDAHYTISISTLTATSFTISATPVAGDLQASDTICGVLTLTNLNVRGPNPTVCW